MYRSSVLSLRLARDCDHLVTAVGTVFADNSSLESFWSTARRITALKPGVGTMLSIADGSLEQGGDLTRPCPARRPPEAAPCHLISTSD